MARTIAGIVSRPARRLARQRAHGHLQAAQRVRYHATQRRIRGIAFAVYAPEVGGKGSISVPSLDVAPGETFSVRIENHLVRPLTAGAGGPSVEVKLDGVLFDDLGFYGPDSLDQQRQMTRWELEARRDREYFKSVLKAGGPQSLQKEMLASQIGRAHV